MKYKYITIEREYGSGGTRTAREVAENCGISCYGREILEMVAAQQNITVEEIDHYEETVPGSFLYTLFMLGKVQSGASDMMTKEGHVFLAEQAVIRQLAARGPAVFIGHCASEALKETTGVLRIFIHSSDADRTARIIEDYHIPKEKVAETMKRFDKKRANYYFANTARRWSDYNNYDLVLDSSKLGIAGCAAAISGVYQQERTDLK